MWINGGDEVLLTVRMVIGVLRVKLGYGAEWWGDALNVDLALP